ncbi:MULTISPECIES: DUF2142 domain-containing protein [unclassified Granulicatella]|uniref:DUF2142 domain-containing protein n=1 Tax=unclassified Granulicatella TaxID=2630493 RepID=UPI00142FB742|nr:MULTISPECIES: DUF2142 domain-containing protein [unclassified Granulicatella]MBF0780249.1 DUF2142 domain-containing protein [Granulicatella sp. 19428wC4_WM01]
MSKFKKSVACIVTNFKKKWVHILGVWFTIAMSYLYFDGNISVAPKWILGFAGMVFTVLMLLKGKFHNIVGLMIVLSGCVFVFCTPIMDAPDETAHYARSLYISQGQVYLPENTQDAKISKDFIDVEENFKQPLNKTNLLSKPMSTEVYENTKLYATNASSFVPYLPQVTGITIARLFNQSVGVSILLGRFFNLLCYACLIWLAIKKAGELGVLFAILGLMPMSIYLAASFSTDAMANGLTFLVISLVCHFTQKSRVSVKDLIIFFVLCAILITIKLPYVLLIGLLLFIPIKQFEKKYMYFLGIVLIILAAILTVFWLKQSSHINSTVVTLDANPVEKIRYTLAHFNHFSREFYKELVNIIPNRIPSLFTFGWLTYGADKLSWFYLMFISCIVFMFPYTTKLPKLTRFGAVLVALGITGAILMTSYLMWSSVETIRFDGIQGRYLIGVILLGGVALNCSSLFLDTNIEIAECKIQKRNEFILYIALLFVLIAITLTILEYYGVRVQFVH